MKILVLGDVMGISGRKAIKQKLSEIIKENKIDFTIINGENDFLSASEKESQSLLPTNSSSIHLNKFIYTT